MIGSMATCPVIDDLFEDDVRVTKKKLSLGFILFFLVSNDSMVVFVEELGHFSLRNWNQSL